MRFGAAAVALLVIAWFLLGGSGTFSGNDGLPASSSTSSSSQGQPSRLRSTVLKNKGGVGGAADDDDGNNQSGSNDEEQQEAYAGDHNDDHDRPGAKDDDDDKSIRSVSGDEEGALYVGNPNYDRPNEKDDDDKFPLLDQDQYLDWLRWYYENLKFGKPPKERRNRGNDKLTKPVLEESLRLGCDYMAANQKKDSGNFNYQYDFVAKKMDGDDSPVRQAGALWGMTLCFQSQPTNALYRSSVELGIAFFKNHTVEGPVPGSRMVQYPGEEESQSGVNALYGLALIDYIRTVRDNNISAWETNPTTIQDLEQELATVIRFLKYMQNDDKHFAETYEFPDEERSLESSAYYDGETLLCLVKAAKYIEGYADTLIPIIEDAAPVLAKAYTVDAWKFDEHDSDETKGFYQWSSMVFTEYYYANWKDHEYFGDLVLVLAHWIIHTHEILERNANTGYAFEGIISAYRIAETRNHEEAKADLSYTIDEGLYKLGSWQVGGPLAHTNDFLVQNPTNEKIAIGGVMNGEDEAPLRIDTTQHQMHAVMMALETLFEAS